MSTQISSLGGTSIDAPGLIWNRLHEERDDVCEAMIHERCSPHNDLSSSETKQSCLELMQSRLSKIDDALDRVASGHFGYCTNCGNELEPSVIDLDAAAAECDACAQINVVSPSDNFDVTDGLSISTRAAFDVIHVQTSHSSYRFLLIDPLTGRCLVEGGKYFSEPTEATILGSSTRTAAFRSGWIGIGFRLEIWAVDQLISTSAVTSVHVEHSIADEIPSELHALYC